MSTLFLGPLFFSLLIISPVAKDSSCRVAVDKDTSYLVATVSRNGSPNPAQTNAHPSAETSSSSLGWKGWMALLALLLSLINFWYNFFLKGKPIFSCTRWTAVQMQTPGGPRASFAVQVAVYNKGRVPLQLYDFLLHAKSDDGQSVSYQPLVLWDLRQWIEDGNRPDRVGRTQKGQVPLPLIISPGQLYDFSYTILFVPLDNNTLINPQTANSVTLTLHARTDRADDYQEVAKQEFATADLRAVLTNAFSSIISSQSVTKREQLLRRINAESQTN